MGDVVEREARGDEWPCGLVDDDAPPIKFGKPWATSFTGNLADLNPHLIMTIFEPSARRKLGCRERPFPWHQ